MSFFDWLFGRQPKTPPPPTSPPPPPPVVHTVEEMSANPLNVEAGVNAHFSYRNGPWQHTNEALDLLLGLRPTVVRQLLPSSKWAQDTVIAAMRTLATEGIGWYCPIIGPSCPGDPTGARTYVDAQLNVLERSGYDLDALRGFPGPNEPNTDGVGWAERTRVIQCALWEAVQARGWSVPVASPPLNLKNWKTTPADVAALGDLSAWCDYGDTHLYQGAGGPWAQVDEALGMLSPLWGADASVVVSETGWTTPDPFTYTGGGGIVTLAAQAAYMSTLPIEWARRDILPIVYELLDDTSTDQREGGFGLVACSSDDPGTWTPKPAYVALRNVLAFTKSAGSTQPLRVRVDGDVSVQRELIDIGLGRHALCLWNRNDLGDSRDRNRVLSVPGPTPVTIVLDQPAEITAHYPEVGASSYIGRTTSTNVTVGTALTILEVGGA